MNKQAPDWLVNIMFFIIIGTGLLSWNHGISAVCLGACFYLLARHEYLEKRKNYGRISQS